MDKEAACAHFGVWWSVKGGRPIDRTDEYARIRGLYGCFQGGPANENAPSWEEIKPKVEIYELSGAGEYRKVSSVIDDPEGEHIPITEREDEPHLRSQMAAMQEALNEMAQKLETSDAIVAAHTAPDLPPADSPDNAPKRRRQAPRIEGARLDEAAGE